MDAALVLFALMTAPFWLPLLVAGTMMLAVCIALPFVLIIELWRGR